MKKILTLALPFCMILSMLAGCGSNKQETPSASQTPDVPAATETYNFSIGLFIKKNR